MRNSEMRESNMSKSSLTTDISKYPDGLMASSSRALGPDSQKGTVVPLSLAGGKS